MVFVIIQVQLCVPDHFFNSFPPSAAYMCQWTRSALVQVTACRLFDTKPLPEPMLAYCQLNKLQWNFNRYIKLFIHENAFESVVCKMASISFRGRWVHCTVIQHCQMSSVKYQFSYCGTCNGSSLELSSSSIIKVERVYRWVGARKT